MNRKFLFCFPLRLGNVVFGYIVIIISMAVVAFNLYQLGLAIITKDDNEYEAKFGNFDKLENIFGEEKNDLVRLIVKIYYLTYVVIGLLLFIFASMFTCGASKANNSLVTTFFVYCFFHLLLTVGLIVWESVTAGWIQLGLILLSDLFLVICLISVKYLMEAIKNGNIYSRPGEVLYKY